MSAAVLSVAEMCAAEQAAIEAGTSEWELMQRAGRGAAQWIRRMAGGKSVCVLCGPGNNGGDGYVIAEELRRLGLSVRIVGPSEPKTQTALRARETYKGDVDQAGLPNAAVYVDCLFGYGLSRDLSGEFAELVEALAKAEGSKIAVDVPSSISSDTGAYLGPRVTYDLTIALGAWKHAHFTMPAQASMGIKRLVDIGIDLPNSPAQLSRTPKLSAPAADTHKYARGMLAIVAGAMPGAPLLAAEAAVRSGAGYVKLLSQHSHPDAPAELVINERPLDQALSDTRISAILVGPGLGRGEDALDRLRKVLATEKPVVLDADALHLLTPGELESTDASQIAVTPHEGELAALCDAFEVEGVTKADRAMALHRESGLTVLAKGPDTKLAGKKGIRYFGQGSSWLSAAGTGDVLAGIAASRLAVHGDVPDALEQAVWLHHEAARISGPAFTAGELAKSVSIAVREFL